MIEDLIPHALSMRPDINPTLDAPIEDVVSEIVAEMTEKRKQITATGIRYAKNGFQFARMGEEHKQIILAFKKKGYIVTHEYDQEKDSYYLKIAWDTTD